MIIASSPRIVESTLSEAIQTMDSNVLEQKAKDLGARYFGIADLATAKEVIVEQGGEFLGTFPRAISIGIAMNDEIVNQLPVPPGRDSAALYKNYPPPVSEHTTWPSQLPVRYPPP